MRTAIIYGNCQAEFIRDVLRAGIQPGTDLRFVYVCSFLKPGVREPLPTDEDFRSCVLLCEQRDWKPFADRDRLPPSCATIRFPPLDSIVLWPFSCINPYDRPVLPDCPYGLFPFGDRVILREIDRGASLPEVLSFYLTGWNEYGVNIARMLALERVRLKKRDEGCDVPAADLILDRLASERLFWNTSHPTKQLLVTWAERVIAALGRVETSVRTIDVPRVVADHPKLGSRFGAVAVPVHPAVAGELGLTWYDAQEVYQQEGGRAYAYRTYFAEMIDHCIRSKGAIGPGAASVLPTSWQPPLRGAAVTSEVSGYFPDGFVGELLTFNLIPEAPIRELSIEGFCPEQHRAPLRLDCFIDEGLCAVATVQPGEPFCLKTSTRLEAGECVKVELRSSTVMNLKDRGESEDARDLSVLIIAIEVH